MHSSCLLVLLAGSVSLAAASDTWSYEGDTGPSHWSGVCASGTSQSPVDLDPSVATYDAALKTSPLSYQGYMQLPATASWQIINNGHTVQVNLNPGQYYISNGPLPAGTYEAIQFHMHWGCDNDEGSEHTINGQQYPLEIHIVHKSTKYSTIDEALTHADGIAVIGQLVNVVEDDNDDLESFFNALPSLTQAGSESTITSFHLMKLLPDMEYKYYTYAGSLTTPTCNEAVTWIVFDELLDVSEGQLAALRTLKTETGTPLQDNYRPVQDLNGRTVRTNEQPE